MFVSVTFLRRFGRRLTSGDSPPDMVGNLVVAARRGMLIAELRGSGPMTDDPLAVLWDVRTVEISETIRLRGYEQSGGAGMLQEWECRIITRGTASLCR